MFGSGAVASSVTDIFNAIIERIRATARVETVYGETRVVDGRSVIPVARRRGRLRESRRVFGTFSRGRAVRSRDPLTAQTRRRGTPGLLPGLCGGSEGAFSANLKQHAGYPGRFVQDGGLKGAGPLALFHYWPQSIRICSGLSKR